MFLLVLFFRGLLSRRLVGAAVLLLALLATEFCSAAEGTFGPGDKYSLQLPTGWTSTLQKDKTLGANGPGRLTLNAFIGSTETSPEALMEKVITGSTEKKAGYKLIEKGTVKNSAGRTAHLHRYQLDAKSGTEVWVDYYFQLAEKEVVILVFAFPSDAPKSVRSEIEAIFNSVKVAAATGQEDSWLATPAEKSKGDSKATSAEDSKIAGRYVNGSDYIELKADKTLTFQISGEAGAGTYTRNGTTVTLKFSDGDSDDAKLENDALVDHGGKRWVRKTEASSSPKEASKKPDSATPADPGAEWPCAIDAETRSAAAKVKLDAPKPIPGTDASISFPAGWRQETGNWPNKTLIVFNNRDATARIAVYGRSTTTLAQYVSGQKQKAETEFRGGAVCPYTIVNGPSGTASLYQVRRKAEDDWEIHAVFAFPSQASGEVTLVDCITSKEIEPEDRAIFEASLQNLKLPKSDASSSKSAGTTSGTLATFGSNCSVQLPGGWTAKPSGKHLEAKGPGGATVDGFSVQSTMSLEEALAQHLSVFEKMPGYELVDTDDVSTEAGAEGKLSVYRYTGKNGPAAEVGVVIKAAKNQIVTLRFLAPTAAKKLDDNFMKATEAIFSSLKISE